MEGAPPILTGVSRAAGVTQRQSLAAAPSTGGTCDAHIAGLQPETRVIVAEVMELGTLVSLENEILHAGLRVCRGCPPRASTDVVAWVQVRGRW